MPFFLTLVHDKLYAGFHRYNGLSIEPLHICFCLHLLHIFFLTIFSMIIKKTIKVIKAVMVFHLILTFSLTYYFCFSVCYALKILRDFKLSNISNLFFSVFIFLFLIKLFVDKESLEVLAFGLEYRLQGELGDSQSSSYNLDFIKSF